MARNLDREDREYKEKQEKARRAAALEFSLALGELGEVIANVKSKAPSGTRIKFSLES